MDDGPHFSTLNLYNSAVNVSISLKFGTAFDHMTPDVLQMFKVIGSKVKLTAWRNVAAVTLY